MSLCQELPACGRESCGRPACEHLSSDPHPLPTTGCEAYVWPEAQGSGAPPFQGGGGSFGGGGATVRW